MGNVDRVQAEWIGWPKISPTAEDCSVPAKQQPTALLMAMLAVAGAAFLGFGSAAVCQAGELVKLIARDASADTMFGTSTLVSFRMRKKDVFDE